MNDVKSVFHNVSRTSVNYWWLSIYRMALFHSQTRRHMICPCIVLQCSNWCPFLFCNYLAGDERAGCFTDLYDKCHVVAIIL